MASDGSRDFAAKFCRREPASIQTALKRQGGRSGSQLDFDTSTFAIRIGWLKIPCTVPRS